MSGVIKSDITKNIDNIEIVKSKQDILKKEINKLEKYTTEHFSIIKNSLEDKNNIFNQIEYDLDKITEKRRSIELEATNILSKAHKELKKEEDYLHKINTKL